MYTDVVELRRFYDTPQGQVVRRLLRRRLREFWPDLRGQSLLGLGYAAPFMRPFLDEARAVLTFMPAAQGVVFWPQEGPGRVALVEETQLPVAEHSIDRVIMVHSLECTERLRPLLREVWRVLCGTGRLLLVVPNRTGLWARSDSTPFGHGHPYSAGQLHRLLRDLLFIPERTAGALFVPPMRSRLFLRSAGAWEQVGGRWLPGLSGVTLLEASKQLYAIGGRTEAARVRRPVLVPVPSGVPTSRRTIDPSALD